MRTFCLSVQIVLSFQKLSSSGCLFLFIFYIKEHILLTIESFFTRVLLTAVIGQKRFILANEITERDNYNFQESRSVEVRRRGKVVLFLLLGLEEKRTLADKVKYYYYNVFNTRFLISLGFLFLL